MAGHGPPPSESRRRANVPERGEWVAAPGWGWQHGPTPPAPDELSDAAVEAWETWFRAWWASNWTPDDLPGLRQVIRLYDQVEQGKFTRTTELRLLMDTYGITPKGQQDRRWKRPEAPIKAVAKKAGRYEHLRGKDALEGSAVSGRAPEPGVDGAGVDERPPTVPRKRGRAARPD